MRLAVLTINRMLYRVIKRAVISRCIMALIRGVGSNFLCPRCLIPCNKLGDLSASAPLQTTAGTKATILKAKDETRLGKKEEILKGAGVRDVDVCLHSYYSRSTLLLTTSSTERILENQQLGPTRYLIFRSSPYFPWRSVPTSSLGSPSNTCRGVG